MDAPPRQEHQDAHQNLARQRLDEQQRLAHQHLGVHRHLAYPNQLPNLDAYQRLPFRRR
jgi:hypothetical protein